METLLHVLCNARRLIPAHEHVVAGGSGLQGLGGSGLPAVGGISSHECCDVGIEGEVVVRDDRDAYGFGHRDDHRGRRRVDRLQDDDIDTFSLKAFSAWLSWVAGLNSASCRTAVYPAALEVFSNSAKSAALTRFDCPVASSIANLWCIPPVWPPLLEGCAVDEVEGCAVDEVEGCAVDEVEGCADEEHADARSRATTASAASRRELEPMEDPPLCYSLFP